MNVNVILNNLVSTLGFDKDWPDSQTFLTFKLVEQVNGCWFAYLLTNTMEPAICFTIILQCITSLRHLLLQPFPFLLTLPTKCVLICLLHLLFFIAIVTFHVHVLYILHDTYRVYYALC